VPSILNLTEQITAAGRMALRCHAHLSLWTLTAGVEGRTQHRVVLEDNWEHMRFLEHGQLFTAVIELHSLLDANSATINLPHLTVSVEAEYGAQPLIKRALEDIEPTFSKLRTLWNGVYAHRTKRKAYADMFKKAAITPDQLHELVVKAIEISNELRVIIGLGAEEPSSLPAEAYETMLLKLGYIDNS